MENSKDLVKRFKSVKNKFNKLKDNKIEVGKPVVAAFGILNAGKSYLLNMLSLNIQDEYFKTNDHRETTEILEYESEKFIYVDTPGLDANNKDTDVAMQGIEKADVVLFIHQMNAELDAAEIKFLRGVCDQFGDFAIQKVILVLTKLDSVEPKTAEEIQVKIQKQCAQILSIEPQCFCVSGKRYKNGLEKHKGNLAKASNIGELVERIEQVTDSISVMDTRLLKRQIAIQQMQLNLTEIKNEFHSIIESEKNELNTKFKVFNKSVVSLIHFKNKGE